MFICRCLRLLLFFTRIFSIRDVRNVLYFIISFEGLVVIVNTCSACGKLHNVSQDKIFDRLEDKYPYFICPNKDVKVYISVTYSWGESERTSFFKQNLT